MSVDSLGLNNVLFGNRAVDEISSSVRKMSSPDKFQYEDVAQMDPKTIAQLDNITLNIAQTEKYTLSAENLESKTGAALVATDRMRHTLNDVVALIHGYNRTMDQSGLDLFKAKINECLGSIATGLNSTYGDGRYIFGGGKDDTIKPVNEEVITKAGNIAPDGTISDSFTMEDAKSADRIIDITSHTTANESIKSNDPAFVHVLAGIWGVKKVLDAVANPNTLPDALPAASITFLDIGITEFNNLTSDIKQRNDDAKEAIVTNKSEQDASKQSLDGMKIDFLQVMTKLKESERTRSMLLGLTMMLMRNDEKNSERIVG